MAPITPYRLAGLIAAPFTPFTADGSLAIDRIKDYAAHLVAIGVDGAFVNGTTGEGASLTTEERIKVAREWREVSGQLKIVVHVGHNALGDSIAMARHAAEIGADAVGMIAPSFFRPDGVAGLVEVCAKVAAAAPELPFYYYHMPAMTGFNVSVAEFLRTAGDRIPNLAGVKFTHQDLLDFGLARQVAGGQFDLLHGRDETLLCGLMLGATGAVGSTYNYLAPLYREIMTAFAAGDLVKAREGQFTVQRIIEILVRFGGGVVGGKAIMGMVGIDCGPLRVPLPTLSPVRVAAFAEELKALDFFRWTGGGK